MSFNTLPVVLKNTPILLIGGGTVALQKATVLQRNNIDFKIISSQFLDSFKNIKVPKIERNFTIKDMKNYFIIIDATGSKEIEKKLLNHKKKINFLYNCVDNPNVCDFFFSALIEYNSLKISVSSSGASPTLAKIVRDKIKSILPIQLKELNNELKQQRKIGIINTKKAKEDTLKILAHITILNIKKNNNIDSLDIKIYTYIANADIVFIEKELQNSYIINIIPKYTKQIFISKIDFNSLNEYISKGLEILCITENKHNLENILLKHKIRFYTNLNSEIKSTYNI